MVGMGDPRNNNFGDQGATFFLSHLFFVLQKIFAINRSNLLFGGI